MGARLNPTRPHKHIVKQAVVDGKAPRKMEGSAGLIAELPEPMQGFLLHAYRAVLRVAKVPESWHDAMWRMPKGTATGDFDTYRPKALGRHDMRMLMTPSCGGSRWSWAARGWPRTGRLGPWCAQWWRQWFLA